jgi:hypothetical protein
MRVKHSNQVSPMKRIRIDVTPTVDDQTVERNRYVVALYYPRGDS